MHSGLYRFEKRQSVTSNGSIVTDNAEAVRIISCLEYASPGQLEQSGFPKVRLAVSRGQVTTDAEKIVRFFSAVSRAFRNLKEEGKGYVMSRDERRAILGWLQGMLPEDKRNGDKIGLEVCQDGFLRLFRRDLRKSGAPLFTAKIYELRLDAKSGKVEGGGCGSAGEAEFCPCWACTSGRGETYGAGIVGGADYFRMGCYETDIGGSTWGSKEADSTCSARGIVSAAFTEHVNSGKYAFASDWGAVPEDPFEDNSFGGYDEDNFRPTSVNEELDDRELRPPGNYDEMVAEETRYEREYNGTAEIDAIGERLVAEADAIEALEKKGKTLAQVGDAVAVISFRNSKLPKFKRQYFRAVVRELLGVESFLVQFEGRDYVSATYHVLQSKQGSWWRFGHDKAGLILPDRKRDAPEAEAAAEPKAGKKRGADAELAEAALRPFRASKLVAGPFALEPADLEEEEEPVAAADLEPVAAADLEPVAAADLEPAEAAESVAAAGPQIVVVVDDDNTSGAAAAGPRKPSPQNPEVIVVVDDDDDCGGGGGGGGAGGCGPRIAIGSRVTIVDRFNHHNERIDDYLTPAVVYRVDGAFFRVKHLGDFGDTLKVMHDDFRASSCGSTWKHGWDFKDVSAEDVETFRDFAAKEAGVGRC